MKTLYDAIGISFTASRAEIEAVCLRLGGRYKHDVDLGDASAGIHLEEVERAYEVLIDPARRTSYDATLAPRPSHGFSRKKQFAWLIVLTLIAIAITAVFGFNAYTRKQAAARIVEQQREQTAQAEQQRQVAARIQKENEDKARSDDLVRESKRIAEETQLVMQDDNARTEVAQKALERGMRQLAGEKKLKKVVGEIRVTQRVAAQMSQLEPLWRRVLRTLASASAISSVGGASVWLGEGELLAMETMRIEASGCAIEVKARTITAAQTIEAIAGTWNRDGSYDPDLQRSIPIAFRNSIIEAVRYCQQAIDEDIVRFGRLAGQAAVEATK